MEIKLSGLVVRIRENFSHAATVLSTTSHPLKCSLAITVLVSISYMCCLPERLIKVVKVPALCVCLHRQLSAQHMAIVEESLRNQ